MQPERLNRKNPKGYAIVRPTTINEIVELHRNDVAPRNGSNNGFARNLWQAGGKARFIYLPPGLMMAQAKSLLIELELSFNGDNNAQAKAA